jgi:hypothetical protein
VPGREVTEDVALEVAPRQAVLAREGEVQEVVGEEPAGGSCCSSVAVATIGGQ